MQHLVAVATVDDAAAVCDYLEGDSTPDADGAIHAVVVHPDEDPTGERDRKEALNVLDVRLFAANVETEERRGDPVEELSAVVDRLDPDEVVVGDRLARSVDATPAADAGDLDVAVTARLDEHLDGAGAPVVVPNGA